MRLRQTQIRFDGADGRCGHATKRQAAQNYERWQSKHPDRHHAADFYAGTRSRISDEYGWLIKLSIRFNVMCWQIKRQRGRQCRSQLHFHRTIIAAWRCCTTIPSCNSCHSLLSIPRNPLVSHIHFSRIDLTVPSHPCTLDRKPVSVVYCAQHRLLGYSRPIMRMDSPT